VQFESLQDAHGLVVDSHLLLDFHLNEDVFEEREVEAFSYEVFGKENG